MGRKLLIIIFINNFRALMRVKNKTRQNKIKMNKKKFFFHEHEEK